MWVYAEQDGGLKGWGIERMKHWHRVPEKSLQSGINVGLVPVGGLPVGWESVQAEISADVDHWELGQVWGDLGSAGARF